MPIRSYARDASRKTTPQSEPIPGREAEQVENSAGGFVFAVDDWTRLRRFLVLGSEGGTYYADGRALTRDNVRCLDRLIKVDGFRVVEEIVEVSIKGRAPKNDPAIFALAMVLKTGDTEGRRAAARAVSKVCRIGTHLFQLAVCVDALGGWGRLTRRAFARWYEGGYRKGIEVATPETEGDFQAAHARHIALQVAKYRAREGWTHRDVLRLSHPHPRRMADPVAAVVAYAAGKGPAPIGTILEGFERAMAAETPAETARLVRQYDLPRECVNPDHLNAPGVWDALFVKMPLTAMIRNLGKMTAIDMLKPLSPAISEVARRLRDPETLRRARVHPISILLALRTYASGHGVRGSLVWHPIPQIIDALNDAFYASFKNIEPTGKRHLLALDVSGSMGSPAGGTLLSCAEAGAAMLMATLHAEPASHAVAFSDGTKGGGWLRNLHGTTDQPVTSLPISGRERLDDVLAKTRGLNFGRTDCSAPMRYALEKGIDVDVFVVYTDNETWYGKQHPTQALQEYRRKTGIPAKLVVVAMTPVGFSIADPADAGMLDVVGFDASMPAVLSDFARG